MSSPQLSVPKTQIIGIPSTVSGREGPRHSWPNNAGSEVCSRDRARLHAAALSAKQIGLSGGSDSIG